MGSEFGVTAESKPEIVLNSVSIFWVVFGNVWTLAVVAGMTYLIVNRNSATLRIRGLGLSLSAIVLLHLYFWACQYGVMVGPLEPMVAQYWIMGIYLPCGIALFHASNSRFLHVAKLQKRYVRPESRLGGSRPDSQKSGGLINRFRRLNYNTKMLISVGASMFFQVFLTILMYLISRKFHSTWGIPGTEVHGTAMEQATEQGRGWEWWPGVLSQFVWSWIIAPYVLWKSRNIHDTQGWRVQTIGCAIANLPATPMWLIALYVDGMAPVNKVWLPPQWICMSIFFIEIFTVFLPCWEVMRHQVLQQETLNLISQWEAKTKGSNSDIKSIASGSTVVGSIISGIKSIAGSVKSNSSRDSILTMGALESVLERNPTPLQKYSALNDFSGENIAFLTSVHQWKNSLPKSAWGSPATRDEDDNELMRERFNRALHIYAEFISVRHAEFPINISSQDLRKLENVFEEPTRLLYGEEREVDPVTPFDLPVSEPAWSPTYSEFSEKASQSTISAIKDRVQFCGTIPESFDATVFDAAEESIKYLVLTNTWPKFLRDRRVSMESCATLQVSGVEMV